MQRGLDVREAGVEQQVRNPRVGVDDGDVVLLRQGHPEGEGTRRLAHAALPGGDRERLDH